MEFIGKTYRGAEFAEIFLKLQYAQATFSKPLVNVLDNVKGELVLNSASANPTVKAYNSRPTKSVNDGVKVAEYIVSPKRRMIYEEFSPVEQLKSRFDKTMKAGASNMDSTEFDDLVLEMYAAEMAEIIAKSVWQGDVIDADGLIDKLYASAGTSKIDGALLSAVTIKDAMQALYMAENADKIIQNGEGILIADRSVKRMVVSANTNADFRDLFSVTNGEHYFQDVKIEYAPLGLGKMILARPKDLIVATDLVSDFASIQTDKVQANSEDKFIKMIYTMDTTCIAPENVSVYVAA